MYLQVMENNFPALALYARAGFEKFYQYHYAEGPEDRRYFLFTANLDSRMAASRTGWSGKSSQ